MDKHHIIGKRNGFIHTAKCFQIFLKALDFRNMLLILKIVILPAFHYHTDCKAA